MTRAEIIQRVEGMLERLDAHDELTASALREEIDLHGTAWGMNAWRSVEGSVVTILSAYEEVDNVRV